VIDQNLAGKRTLEIQLAGFVGDVGEGAAAETSVDDREILRDRGGVGHDHGLVLTQAEDDQVVDDAAILVEQEAVARAPDRDRTDRKGEDILQAAVCEVALIEELTHVADIEERRLLAAPGVLGDDSLVLDRHLPAAERGDQRLQVPVPIVERCLLESFHGMISGIRIMD